MVKMSIWGYMGIYMGIQNGYYLRSILSVHFLLASGLYLLFLFLEGYTVLLQGSAYINPTFSELLLPFMTVDMKVSCELLFMLVRSKEMSHARLVSNSMNSQSNYVSQVFFRSHYSFLMSQKSSCFAAAWDLAPCPHFHYLPNDLLHHQAGDRKGKVSNFRWLRDRKIGSGILSSSGIVRCTKLHGLRNLTALFVIMLQLPALCCSFDLNVLCRSGRQL